MSASDDDTPSTAPAARGLRRNLATYGDPGFSLFLRKAFIKAAQAEGVGGQNFTWVGSEAATQAVSEDSELEAALLGYAGLSPSAGTSNEFEQVRYSSSLCSLCCPPQRQFQAL